jgi:hypothetical protein
MTQCPLEILHRLGNFVPGIIDQQRCVTLAARHELRPRIEKQPVIRALQRVYGVMRQIGLRGSFVSHGVSTSRS